MDPNDADIAWILRLEAVAPLDSWSWLKHGSVPWDLIDQDMIGMLQELNVMFKIIETEEGWVVLAQEWADACRTAMQKLYRRMKLRSLELAVGPEKGRGVLGAALPFHQALLRTEQEQAREGFRDDPA